MIGSITMDKWEKAMQESAEELVSQTLGFDTGPMECKIEKVQKVPADFSGAVISLIGEDVSVQLGLAADQKGLSVLARKMLGMEPNEALPEADVADAIGEMANILAGGMKKRLNQEVPNGLKIGLPIFVEKIAKGDRQELLIVTTFMAAIPVHLFLITKREPA